MAEEKIRENRLRRVADRQGLRVEKSKRRDPFAIGFNTFAVFRKATGDHLAGQPNEGAGLTLDQLEAFLTRSQNEAGGRKEADQEVHQM